MDKLEGINKGKFKKGKWFRLNNLNNMVGRISESGLVLFFDVYDFTKSLKPENSEYMDYPKGFGDTFTDLILTHSEALIFFAHGFTLEWASTRFKIIDGYVNYYCSNKEKWQPCQLGGFIGFTIHALPETK